GHGVRRKRARTGTAERESSPPRCLVSRARTAVIRTGRVVPAAGREDDEQGCRQNRALELQRSPKVSGEWITIRRSPGRVRPGAGPCSAPTEPIVRGAGKAVQEYFHAIDDAR